MAKKMGKLRHLAQSDLRLEIESMLVGEFHGESQECDV